ncbi:hypothetical protein ABBQ32_009069 [Trebouxia sp. C0010 RCD-2024]
MPLPKPGDLVQLDFRASHGAPESTEGIKLLQWNIERGYKLEEIVKELKNIDADLIALQEVDIGCERSSNIDTGRHIAEQLGLSYVFFCEFEELHSPLRSPALQGGGVHGNALLSKFDITDARLVHHRMHPVDWNDPTHPLAQTEPRRGQRAVLAATVLTPQGPLLCYCLHMEVFCGMLARIEQFADVMADSKLQLKQGMYHQAVLGDLNTMAHGIARFSPKFCTDKMRFWSLGQSEAALWQKKVFNIVDLNTIPEQDEAQKVRQRSGPSEQPKGDASSTSTTQDSSCPQAEHAAGQQTATQEAGGPAWFPPGLLGPSINGPLRRWGLSEQVCQDITNPGFTDPFGHNNVTLDNPAYRYMGLSLMKGKLDWLLLRKMQTLTTSIGNHSYSASDHKWLSATVNFK